MVSEEVKELVNDELSEIGASFDLLMGASVEKLDTPIEQTISTSGDDEAEALGSARHIAEEIEEYGYTVEIEHLGNADTAKDNLRYRYSFHITE